MKMNIRCLLAIAIVLPVLTNLGCREAPTNDGDPPKKEDGQHSKSSDGPIKLEVRELLLTYKSDPKAARVLYHGKQIELTGVLSRKTSNTLLFEGGTDINQTVKCAFGAAEESNLKAAENHLRKGNTVTVIGTGAIGIQSFVLDNCKLKLPK